MYNKDNQIRYKISILRSSLCDYSDAYILVRWTTTARKTAVLGQANKGANKGNISKLCTNY